MRPREEKQEEPIRLCQEASYWKEQCARVVERQRALLERRKELKAQLREQREKCKELQALKAKVELYEQLLGRRSEKSVPGRVSSDSAQRGDATEEGLGASKD